MTMMCNQIVIHRIRQTLSSLSCFSVILSNFHGFAFFINDFLFLTCLDLELDNDNKLQMIVQLSSYDLLLVSSSFIYFYWFDFRTIEDGPTAKRGIGRYGKC
ncbi:unnamed protein product [Amoebophrya sp. A25]|nr:unnamed protein product [Amoebophrya sp. A25]|eukprot:GSA25T00022972001.1